MLLLLREFGGLCSSKHFSTLLLWGPPSVFRPSGGPPKVQALDRWGAL